MQVGETAQLFSDLPEMTVHFKGRVWEQGFMQARKVNETLQKAGKGLVSVNAARPAVSSNWHFQS